MLSVRGNVENSDWVIELLSDQVTEWPSDQVTEWPSDKVTKQPNDRVTEWLSDRVTKRPSDRATEWSSDRKLRRRLTVWYIITEYLTNHEMAKNWHKRRAQWQKSRGILENACRYEGARNKECLSLSPPLHLLLQWSSEYCKYQHKFLLGIKKCMRENHLKRI